MEVGYTRHRLAQCGVHGGAQGPGENSTAQSQILEMRGDWSGTGGSPNCWKGFGSGCQRSWGKANHCIALGHFTYQKSSSSSSTSSYLVNFLHSCSSRRMFLRCSNLVGNEEKAIKENLFLFLIKIFSCWKI